MQEINIGDKVKLKKDITYIDEYEENGKVYETHHIIWKAGSIHTVKKVALGLVSLNNINTAVELCNVEKVKDEEFIKIYRNPENHLEIIAEDLMNNRRVILILNSNITSDFYDVAKEAFEQLVLRHKFNEKEGDSDKTEEPKKYYNGKIVCTDPSKFSNRFTKGKIYEVVDGQFLADDGYKVPTHGYFSNFKDIEQWTATCKFIEVVE